MEACYNNCMNRVVVITGASRGLGLALATDFATHDWRVVGTGRSAQPAALLPKGVRYHQFDAADASACETFWQGVSTEYPDAEICLVNNAGGYVGGSLTQAEPHDFMQQMQSCYFAAVYMTRSLAFAFPKARIINVISASALAAHKNTSAYGAAKAAEMHFFQALQQEFKPSAYQITNLYPSDIASHGPNSAAIDVQELATFIRTQAELSGSYYLRDATLYPR